MFCESLVYTVSNGRMALLREVHRAWQRIIRDILW